MFRLRTRILCAKHWQPNTADGDDYVGHMEVTGNECEACAEERFQQEVAYVKRHEIVIVKLQQAAERLHLNRWQLKVYVAGPMMGYANFNKPAFHRMERTVKRNGFQILSPAHYTEQDYKKHSYEWLIEQGLRMTLEAHAGIFLTGWQQSRGASLEHQTMCLTGRVLCYEI